MTCPGCGFTADIEAFLLDAVAREVVLLAFSLPAPLGERLLRYLRLFAPPKRALAWDRVLRLLLDLAPAIAEARVERNGRTWAAPLDYWSMALDDMLARRDQLQLPLKSHGYLFEIVAGLSNKAEGKAEAKTEQQRAYAYSRDQKTGDKAGLQRVAPPPEFLAMLARLKGKGSTHEETPDAQ